MCRYIQGNLKPDDQKQFHFFNTFFYKKLSETLSKKEKAKKGKSVHQLNYERVHRWVKRQVSVAADHGVDAFTARKLCLPYNLLTISCTHTAELEGSCGTQDDLFSKDFLFIPIHGTDHWSLVVVCFPGSEYGSKQVNPGPNRRCIVHLDSLGGEPAKSTCIYAGVLDILQNIACTTVMSIALQSLSDQLVGMAA